MSSTFNHRLIEFWTRSKTGVSGTMSGMWQSITDNYQRELIDSLNRGDPSGLETTLQNIGSATYGFEKEHTQRWDGVREADFLYLLGQRTGLLSFPNPEQPMAKPSLEGIKEKLQERLGLVLQPDNFYNYEGAGPPARWAYYLSAAFTIKSLLSKLPETILEVGAGLGFLGFIAWSWGVRSYTVIDLPSVVVLSANALRTVCGAENIWLCGETENKNAFARFFPSTEYSGAKCNYDLIFNCDSMPEMTQTVRSAYIKFFAECLDNGVFLSINHEAGERVHDDAYLLHLRYRYPFMMRPGYLEEIYTKRGSVSIC